jgi:pyruvate ferredoxin oxidoreductase alpha subunit
MSVALARRVGLTGNDAVALAWKQIHPDVVAAYPITPSTQVVEKFSQYVADGVVQTQFVPVESEHSALSACVGAAVSGARVMTATSSQGLALMHEILYIAAGLRLPIVMAVANRALSAPINIHGDHSDAMGSRDSGWLQFYAKDVQEAYDLTILAVRVAERARLPVMVGLDGFTLSHSLEVVDVYSDEAVRAFVGPGPEDHYHFLDGPEPVTVGPLALPDSYMDFRRALAEAVARSAEIIAQEIRAFREHFGRALPAFVEPVALDGARAAVVMMGSYAGLLEEAVQRWRQAGRQVGLVRVVTFRPFPSQALRTALAGVRHVVVMERADTLSTLGGPLGVELRAALYGTERPPVVSDVIFGLGGREVREEELEQVGRLLEAPAGGVWYLGTGDDLPGEGGP